MKYEDLLIKAYKFEEKISPDFSNLSELLEKDPYFIEISRICLGENIKNFSKEAKVSDNYLKIIRKGKTPPPGVMKKIISYIAEKFTKMEKEKIVESFSKNYVYVDNIDHVKNWIKYDKKYYRILSKYIAIFFYIFLFTLFGGIYFIFLSENAINKNFVVGLIMIFFFSIGVFYIINITLKKPPDFDEIKLFTISAILKNNLPIEIEDAKKYAEYVSQTFCMSERDISEYRLNAIWSVFEIYDKTGKTIQESLIPYFEEKNLGSIVEIFDTLGSLFANMTIDNLVKLRDYLIEIEEKYPSYTPAPSTKVEKAKLLFKDLSVFSKNIWKHTRFFWLIFFEIFVPTMILSYIVFWGIKVEEIIHKVAIFAAIFTGICAVYNVYHKRK